MFTGLVQLKGSITASEHQNARLRIRTNEAFMTDVAEGDSICCDGICLTAVACDKDSFSADLSIETLRVTTAGEWTIGQNLNIEPAMSATGKFGGHIVTGHVDAASIFLEEDDTGNGIYRRYSIPEGLAPLIAEKGSVCIDGVSLTVNDADIESFSVMLIPHTLAVTTLGDKSPGQRVNLEVDIAARYMLRMRRCEAYTASQLTEIS